MSFAKLAGLPPALVQAVETLGFERMTAVQQTAIPLFLGHKDVVVEAVTGSGKTLAFALPILARLAAMSLRPGQIGACVVAPTRELARQIHTVFTSLLTAAAGLDVRCGLYIGGATSLAEDVSRFATSGDAILVGTPGRLDDLFAKRVIDARELAVLVLDEADRLLDMGFQAALSRIIARLPKQRRTGLFSATMTDALEELVRAGLRNPTRVVVKVEAGRNEGFQRTPASLSISYLITPASGKLAHLMNLVAANPGKKFIVYLATCASVDYFYRILKRVPLLRATTSAFSLSSLHGKMDPKRREAVYETFANASAAILLCTDIAARGLDIPDVDWVVQFDPPQDPAQFTHRCGRTARSNRPGLALALLTPQEDTYIDFLRVRKVPMQEMQCAPVGPFTPDSVLQACRALCAKDRDVYERSLTAFVSWMRSYMEHQASYIFNIKTVDLGSVAYAFALLHLPKMPELRQIRNQDGEIEFIEAKGVDVDAIPYTDKLREKHRLAKLATRKASGDAAADKGLTMTRKKNNGNKRAAWSDHTEKRERRLVRAEKKSKKRVAIMQAQQDATKKREQELEDWEELKQDMKKLKRGEDLLE